MHKQKNRIIELTQTALQLLPLRMLLIGLIVAVTSQLYILPGVGSFRFSGSVILFPVLLTRLVPETQWPSAGLATTAFVWTFRVVGGLLGGQPFDTLARTFVPGAMFYFCYDCLFSMMVRDKANISLSRFIYVCFFSDILANVVEMGLFTGFQYGVPSSRFYLMLAIVAMVRSFCALALIGWLGYYRRILLLEEQEQRYQRLFLMTSQLKDEVYFLNKTAGDIESVMSKAYRLYEYFDGNAQENPAMRRLALDIARDVHEVKKGHLRILKGISSGVESVYDRERMQISDLMKILSASMHPSTTGEVPNIALKINVAYDFGTCEHHRLMSIVRNLVANAFEALEAEKHSGTVWVEVLRSGDDIIFKVADDGPGLTARLKDKVFEIGYSTKFNPITGDINRGVGLAAVKSLTEELEGQVTLETQQGKGCTFEVRFPLRRLEESNAHLYH